jgi:hypothetical protein
MTHTVAERESLYPLSTALVALGTVIALNILEKNQPAEHLSMEVVSNLVTAAIMEELS